MAGIHSRLLFSLGSVWPANALLLAMLILRPANNRPVTWILSAAAYFLADFASGTDLTENLVLNAANLAGVATGVAITARLPLGTLALNRPSDPIMVVLVMAGAAGGTAAIGIFAGQILFGMTALEAVSLWWSTEMVNYAMVLPLALALASTTEWHFFSRDRRVARLQAAALAFLLACAAIAAWFGGPGALVVPIPALIWCAVRFRPWVSQALCAAVCLWSLIAVPFGWMSLGVPVDSVSATASFRIGVAMLAICPFAIAALNGAWRAAREALTQAATHDGLTGLKNRSTSMARLGKRSAGCARTARRRC
jgi:hypothetical protein